MKKEKLLKENVRRIFIIVLLLLLLSILYLKSYEIDNSLTQEYIKLSNIEVYYEKDSSIVALFESCYYFEFFTSKEQGNVIEIFYKNIETKRPLTHDIVVEIMKRFGIEPKLVRIDKLINDTFYATIVLKGIFKNEEIDIRPSDGIAIALRSKIPIYVHKALVKNKCEIKSF